MTPTEALRQELLREGRELVRRGIGLRMEAARLRGIGRQMAASHAAEDAERCENRLDEIMRELGLTPDLTHVEQVLDAFIDKHTPGGTQ